MKQIDKHIGNVFCVVHAVTLNFIKRLPLTSWTIHTTNTRSLVQLESRFHACVHTAAAEAALLPIKGLILASWYSEVSQAHSQKETQTCTV